MYLVVERRGEERRGENPSIRASEVQSSGRRAGGVTWELRESDKDN
jgi:hypothetical protein